MRNFQPAKSKAQKLSPNLLQYQKSFKQQNKPLLQRKPIPLSKWQLGFKSKYFYPILIHTSFWIFLPTSQNFKHFHRLFVCVHRLFAGFAYLRLGILASQDSFEHHFKQKSNGKIEYHYCICLRVYFYVKRLPKTKSLDQRLRLFVHYLESWLQQ